MIIHNLMYISSKLKLKRGSGIAVIVFGVFLLLAFIFTSTNLLNAKFVEYGYNNLRDAVMSASSGSVTHLLLSSSQNTTTIGETRQATDITYDPYLQLALGYIINYENSSSPSNSSTIGVERNNFLKFDHQKVITSTLRLIDDTVLGGDRLLYGDVNQYQVIMFFIEPVYDKNYVKSFNLIYYTNKNDPYIEPYKGHFIRVGEGANSMQAIYNSLNSTINRVVNDYVVTELGFPSTKRYNIRLNSGDLSEEELVRSMQTRPYYLIVVKDFALPTIFNTTTQSDGTIKSAFGVDNKLSSPMCALNAGKVERKIVKKDSGVTVTSTLDSDPTPYTFAYSNSIRFDTQGGSGYVSNVIKEDGIALTLPTYNGTKTGYSFAGWCRTPGATNASQVIWGNGGTMTAYERANILYAVWVPNTCKITYNLNGGSGTTPSQVIKNYGENVTVASGSGFSYSGFTFAGWGLSSSSSSPSYYPGGTIGNEVTSDIVLYAVWKNDLSYVPEGKVKVTFNSNGGSGYMPQQEFDRLSPARLTANRFTKTGYTFAGWSMNKNGEVHYLDRANFTAATDLTLYAVWELGTKYTVSFLPNGGTGSMDSVQVTAGRVFYMPDCQFTRNGYTFIGWSESSTNRTGLAVGQPVSVANDKTYYAIWQYNGGGGYIGGGWGPFGSFWQ
ncbi:MAG: InlB B-repeat-containing protein [Clostridia bacterium]|nr:InlB B-repeat-containing protein [Clostridia bacterium]